MKRKIFALEIKISAALSRSGEESVAFIENNLIGVDDIYFAVNVLVTISD